MSWFEEMLVKTLCCLLRAFTPHRVRAMFLWIGVSFCVASIHAASIAEQPVNENDYIDAGNCIVLSDVKETIIIDSRHIVFELRRGKFVLNQLRQACVNLHQDSLLLFEHQGMSLCNLDRLDVRDRSVAGVNGSCSLGRFEEISKAQMVALKEAARQVRGTRLSK